jgi:hypothetical protein
MAGEEAAIASVPGETPKEILASSVAKKISSKQVVSRDSCLINIVAFKPGPAARR